MVWTQRILFVAALGLVVGLPFALRPAEEAPVAAGKRVIVLTPHNEFIRYEVGLAFREWHQRHFGEPVEVDWRKMDGSSTILRLLTAQYEALAAEGKEEEGAGYDIVFGGGDYLFDVELKRGVSVTDAAGNTRKVSITQPITLDAALVHDCYRGEEIAGRRLYDADGHWWGVVLSSFGIVYNRDVLALRDLPEPQTWSDMATPGYFNWVALADPSHSGSIRVTYEAIVQRYGFEHGWQTLRRICANSRYFAAESTQVPIDVSTGEVAAGMCIDFFGRYQSQAVGGTRVGFTAPMEATVVNPDPVAVLRGAPHAELATRFVEFLLTREGQGLWNLRPGDDEGPAMYELRRLPARREMYDLPAARLVDRSNPYVEAQALPEGTPSYFAVVPTVLHAMAIDVHEELQAAWRAILAEPPGAKREQMVEAFEALPFTADELAAAAKAWKADPDRRDADRLAWTRFFLKRYEEVVRVGRS